MTPAAETIRRKRDGLEVNDDDLRELVLAYARGAIPDYQMAAFCMAVFFRGLSAHETLTLTDAMVASGETIDLSAAVGRTVVDKHSTGGVGDKTSIAVGPIVAACGVPFGKMSGRGLGHTGGTLDKLESIPGFRVELGVAEFLEQVRDVGLAIIGQSANLVPADKLLYALRDVTATVDNISLIAASIMSKKIAAGADAILLDVKVGDGAFMKSVREARALAEMMTELGRRAGRRITSLLTDMDQPLGSAVGNALEIREAIETIRGDGPHDFTALVREASAHLLVLGGDGCDIDAARAHVDLVVRNGAALDAYRSWVAAQGGDPSEDALPAAPIVQPVAAIRDGYVSALSAVAVGRAAAELGAGRKTKDDPIDHSVGIRCLKKRGDRVERGEPLAEVHALSAADAARAEAALVAAYALAEEPPAPGPLVIDVVA